MNLAQTLNNQIKVPLRVGRELPLTFKIIAILKLSKAGLPAPFMTEPEKASFDNVSSKWKKFDTRESLGCLYSNKYIIISIG
jgi:hypothetical protein